MTEKSAKKILRIIKDEVDVDFQRLKVSYDEFSDNVSVKYICNDIEGAHEEITDVLGQYDFYEIDSDIADDRGILYFEE